MLDLKELASAIGERAVLPAVGHELRTPLTSIRGYLETVLDEEIDAQTSRRFLEAARRETLRLGRLIDGMVSMLDLAAGQRIHACDAVAQIRASVEMIAPLARPRQVTIRTKLPRAAAARVDGDECIHAVANLIENAIKHGSERGRVDVSCARTGAFVEIAVEDDGAGVEAAEREKVFEIGVRGREDRTGSGIGLAVVKAIARRTGGDVRIESSALGGARFVLRFPAG